LGGSATVHRHVESLIDSTAQPIASGSRSTVMPGNDATKAGPVAAWAVYSIEGRDVAGSAIVSLSSAMEISISRGNVFLRIAMTR
jgi:hypothetical protein